MKNTDATNPLEEHQSEDRIEEKKKTKLTPQEDPKESPESVVSPPESPAKEVPGPVPELKSEPEKEPEPESKPEPEAKSKPAPEAPEEPEPEPEKEPESKPEPEKEPEAKSKPAPTSKGKPDGKGETYHKHGALVDDVEEQHSNDSYDELDDDDHHENGRAGDEEEAEEEAELENYTLLSKEDLVKLMREKLDNPARGNIRKDVEAIRHAFFENQKAAMEEKKAHFLEEGGTLEDFKPAEDPAEAEMKELLKKYRGLKAEYTRQLENTKQENLQRKQHILEELRILMEGQESFEITFRKFKELQRQWFAAGIVPQQNLKDLWDSYNYFVEKFNDYVRINRDLRTLDLKKNLELKIQLCERTEALDKEPNIVEAFRTLQKFHSRWREIGPVPRDNRDEIWERFKQATSAINRKHQEYHARLKDSLHENLEKKEALCVRVEEIAKEKYSSHRTWAEKTNLVLEIQKTWKTIGYAPKKDNNAIYARFRKACDQFFSSKAKFYSAAFDEQKDNLQKKIEIVEKAESLSESQEWKATTTELIRLQKQWKEIGPVPRRESDKLWKRFRAACDRFFHSKSSYFDDIDSSFDDNLKAKKEIIASMDAYKPVKDRKSNMDALSDFQTRFDEIGFVPSNKKQWIKEQFKISQDKLLEKIGLDESEQSVFRFKNRIKGIVHTPRAEMKLNFERDKLMNKLQQLRGDISVWENNIGFFKESESSADTLQTFKDKIDSAHERIRILESKIRILDDMENAN